MIETEPIIKIYPLNLLGEYGAYSDDLDEVRVEFCCMNKYGLQFWGWQDGWGNRFFPVDEISSNTYKTEIEESYI
jgi:hypothetical protein